MSISSIIAIDLGMSATLFLWDFLVERVLDVEVAGAWAPMAPGRVASLGSDAGIKSWIVLSLPRYLVLIGLPLLLIVSGIIVEGMCTQGVCILGSLIFLRERLQG